MGIREKYKAIVIGTSAGGLYAVSAILKDLPASYPIPIIIVQHRAKDQRDLLEEVLQSKCSIKVKQADEKEKIQAGFVYIAPPDYHLLIEEDETFSLSSDEPVRYSRPSIDVLFETAAIVYKDGLVSIVLTGANSDGAAGTVAVRESYGLTIAQDPEEAQFSAMPGAAIATNKVHYILALQQIQDFLLTLANKENEKE